MPYPAELLLIDGTAMLFRAYFSGHRQASQDGLEIGGVALVVRRLQRLLRQRRPVRVAAVFDAGHRTFRHEIDASYKGHRPAAPADMLPQFDLLREAADMLGLPCFCVRGFEADDLMATLSSLARAGGLPCRLWSGDKDLHQLVRDASPTILQEDPVTGQPLTEEGVRRRLGVSPRQVVDYLALVGDSTDNVRGVKGVGPKTAALLLQSFGSLDGIYADLSRVASLGVRGAAALPARLEAGHADALRARDLVALRHDVELGFPAHQLAEVTRWHGPRGSSADRFFARLGLTEPLRQLREQAGGRPGYPRQEGARAG